MLKRNLFFIFSVTIFAFASLILDIFNYNPYISELPIFINFYISLFLSLSGIFGLFIYFIKIKFRKGIWSNEPLLSSIRQGAFFSIAMVGLLILQGMRVLDWWVGVPIVIAIFLLELFFQTSSPKIKHQKKVKRGKTL